MVKAQDYFMYQIQEKLYSKVKLLDSAKVIGLGQKKREVLGLKCFSAKEKIGDKVIWLKKIQPVYYQLDSLEYMIAKVYRLGKTDFNFSHFKNLRILQLVADSLVVFPSGIKDCNRLEKLDISINRFEKLPSWLFGLPSLRVLVMTEGQTDKALVLPKVTENNEKLETIDFHKTKLASIPYGFFKFSELVYLDLSETDLTEFPEEIKNLQKLEYLNLKMTNISEVPLWVFEMPNLKKFALPRVSANWMINNLELLMKIEGEGKIKLF